MQTSPRSFPFSSVLYSGGQANMLILFYFFLGKQASNVHKDYTYKCFLLYFKGGFQMLLTFMSGKRPYIHLL